MKRIVSLILTVSLMISLAPAAFAASEEAMEAANALHVIGIMKGTGTDANGNPNYDLDRAITRNEAVTMLVRLLGKEYTAQKGSWNIPFTDVPEWAKPYVGYAYENGLTSGTSATTYSGNQAVTAAQYLTFVLRALGYESGKDFQWNRAWILADQIGLIGGEYNENTTLFTRGDVAIISASALATNMKGNDATLGDFFYEIFDSKEIIHRKEAEAFQYIIDAQDGMNESLNNIPNYIDTNEELASYLVMTILEYQRYVNQSIAALYYGISECGQSMENKEIKQYLNELIAALIPLRDFPASEGNVEKFPEIRDNALQRIEEVIDKYEEEFSLWDIL